MRKRRIKICKHIRKCNHGPEESVILFHGKLFKGSPDWVRLRRAAWSSRWVAATAAVDVITEAFPLPGHPQHPQPLAEEGRAHAGCEPVNRAHDCTSPAVVFPPLHARRVSTCTPSVMLSQCGSECINAASRRVPALCGGKRRRQVWHSHQSPSHSVQTCPRIPPEDCRQNISAGSS